ncbi:MAG: 3-deoxy-8-phosphooctulonate synthase [Lentisphaerae bacterium RIFOXYA12_FULL_48_11]|nr:MAG: 3-deoxy-8-phosphooctulonate synthase [Lentisphaerae bacterium RIFOXYA12_FULL_48_11]
MTKTIKAGKVRIGGAQPLALIAGPCVIEGRQACISLAGKLVKLANKERIPFIFKASYDKANRSSLNSYRGPGLAKGLSILSEIKEKFGVPILTDVHSVAEVGVVSLIADIIQIPAFLCRQTDLIIAAAESGKVINVKKGQFLAPWDVKNIIDKIESTGNRNILLTERGVSFGYNNLVADMRSLLVMRDFGYPVIFDATHSVQKPGGAGNRSGGDGQWAPALARAAVATGCDAVFMETHEKPAKALSDSDNAVAFGNLVGVWRRLRRIDEIVD